MAFKLEKTSVNEYQFVMKDEDLKRLSFKIFSSLEKIIKDHENFIIIKQEYNDKQRNIVRSKLSCRSFKDQEKKHVQDYLELELFGGYKYNNNSLYCSYNQLDVQLQSDVKEVDTRIIEDLFKKFRSFEEVIQKKYEELRKFILEDSFNCAEDGRIG